MKTACVYHSRDLDGWMSAAIVKLAKEKGTTIDFIGYDYGQEIPDLSEYEEVVMVDISFPIEKMIELKAKIGLNLIWIDHHISAIKDSEKDPNYEAYPTAGLRDVKFAACELAWMHFFPAESMPEIVRLLGRYDCFGHKGTGEEKKVLVFQYAARAALSNYEECFDALLRIQDIESWLNTGNGIYNYLCTEAKQIYGRRFTLKFGEYTFGCVNHDRFNPVNFGIDYHADNYDGFACFWYGNRKWSFSLYNDDGKVDCSAICKERGGGGHKGAAGFTIDNIDVII